MWTVIKLRYSHIARKNSIKQWLLSRPNFGTRMPNKEESTMIKYQCAPLIDTISTKTKKIICNPKSIANFEQRNMTRKPTVRIGKQAKQVSAFLCSENVGGCHFPPAGELRLKLVICWDQETSDQCQCVLSSLGIKNKNKIIFNKVYL